MDPIVDFAADRVQRAAGFSLGHGWISFRHCQGRVRALPLGRPNLGYWHPFRALSAPAAGQGSYREGSGKLLRSFGYLSDSRNVRLPFECEPDHSPIEARTKWPFSPSLSYFEVALFIPNLWIDCLRPPKRPGQRRKRAKISFRPPIERHFGA